MDSVVDKEDRSGLYLAAESNHLRCVKTLLKTGARAELLERNDRWDNTALHIASIRGHLDIVTALIEAGAQIDNKNEDEQTPLHVAAKHGKLKYETDIRITKTITNEFKDPALYTESGSLLCQ